MTVCKPLVSIWKLLTKYEEKRLGIFMQRLRWFTAIKIDKMRAQHMVMLIAKNFLSYFVFFVNTETGVLVGKLRQLTLLSKAKRANPRGLYSLWNQQWVSRLCTTAYNGLWVHDSRLRPNQTLVSSTIFSISIKLPPQICGGRANPIPAYPLIQTTEYLILLLRHFSTDYGCGIPGLWLWNLCRWFRFAQLAKGKKSRP